MRCVATGIVFAFAVAIHTGLASSPSGYKSRLNQAINKENGRKTLLRRFIHGCPFAFPCPPPPCLNPVYGPHDCCGSCPDPEPEVTDSTSAPKHASSGEAKRRLFSGESAIWKRLLIKNGDEHAIAKRMTVTMTTTPPPTTTDCPYPCTYGGQHYCHPFPCYIRCVDAIRPPGSCCEVCPNGPNCHYNGHIIPEGHNATFGSGVVVYCANGDVYGGNLHIYQPVVGK